MIDLPEKVKELFKMDGIRKNIRIHFPNGESPDIINDRIIKESFKLTESICSQDKIKFGLCESSVVQFECMDVDNIKGYTIEVYNEIDISLLDEDFINEYGLTSEDLTFPFYRLFYGTYIVDECERQTDAKKRNVVAYSKTHNNDWNFNEVTRSVLQNNIWKYPDVNLTFSIEGIVDLLIPENAHYSLGKKRESYTIHYSIGQDSHGNGYALYVTYDVWTRLRHENGWIVECIKEKYDKEYIRKVRLLKDELNKIEMTYYYSRGLNPIYLSYVPTSNLNYTNYDRYSSKDIEETKEIMYDDRKDVPIFSDILHPQNSTVSYPRIWQRYDFPDSDDIERWDNDVTANVRIPTQIQLVNLTNNEIIFDTGKYNNEALYNNESPVFLDNSDLGYFLTLAIPYKKTITMEKYNVSSNSYTEVNETVYCYEPQSIDDLKHIIESYLELKCSFGRYGRDGHFSQVSIGSNFGLFPTRDLYPSEIQFPSAPSGGVLTRDDCISAWYDEDMKSYGRVEAYYINEDDKETYANYDIVNPKTIGWYEPKKYLTYSISDNFLIKNNRYTKEQINDILKTIGESIKNIKYMPAEIELIGLPWIEVGDVVQTMTNDSGIETIVLRRTLSGIQTLYDAFESK